MIVPAMKVAGEAHQHGLPGISPSNAQSQQRRFGARGCKAHALRARDHLPNQLAPFDLQLMGSAVVSPPRKLRGYCLYDRWMIVAEH
ncbi:MAG TPA: hypothetical protein VFA54_00415 [Bryobacterales bacterium]|nr:hypothetical protein [Bryobacterales bacterium]